MAAQGVETGSMKCIRRLAAISALLLLAPSATAEEAAAGLPRAFIDGAGQGWRALGADDFENVNCADDTWTWQDGAARCTGNPVGVIASRKTFTNFELVTEWRHRLRSLNRLPLPRIRRFPGRVPQAPDPRTALIAR